MPYVPHGDPHVAAVLGRMGNRVRMSRGALGLSQRAVEDLSGVDQTSISRLENGRASNMTLGRFATVVVAIESYDPWR
jgi:transcriptional regulator with XRE-family HTH domain